MSSAEERLANDPTSELWGEHRARYRFALERLHLHPGQHVLDVACGAGFGLEMLTRAGLSAFGADYDFSTLRGLSHRIFQADATCLPLRDGSVEAIVSFETIEHVQDAGALVAELRRVLADGGELILSTPNRSFGPPEHHQNPFHIREFTAVELRDLLHQRFSEVQLLGQVPTPGYRYIPFLMVERALAPSALAWKAMLRLPFALRNRLALKLSGRPFYPGEEHYCFEPEATQRAHALVAIAR